MSSPYSVNSGTPFPALPYCMVLAVATVDSVLLYDKQVREGMEVLTGSVGQGRKCECGASCGAS